MSTNATVEKLVSLCKRRGFVFQSSEIYGGIGGFWDYGPLGVELKSNIKRAWWKAVVQERDDMVGLDAAILMNPHVWEASGHVDTFADPMVDCKDCKRRFRADELAHHVPASAHGHAEATPVIRCPECGGELTEPRMFNLMFKTFVGPVEDDAAVVYLRPETAQGIFVNFDNVLTDHAPEAPLRHRPDRQGLPQRDHPRQLHLPRPRVRADGDRVLRQAGHGRGVARALGGGALQLVPEPRHRARRTCACAAWTSDELAHYAKGTYEVEYLFPMGWSELEGIANRTDFDLSRHTEFSGKDLEYFDEETKEHFVPYVIEPSAGVDRLLPGLPDGRLRRGGRCAARRGSSSACTRTWRR